MIVVVIVGSMLLLGERMNAYIRNVELGTAATAHASFINALIAPMLRDGVMTEDQRRELDALLSDYISSGKIESVLVWSTDGVVAYSTDPAITGKHDSSDELTAAMQGQSSFRLETGPALHGLAEGKQAGGATLEFYVPIAADNGRVVAVVEFYQNGAPLFAQIRSVAWKIWGGIAITTALMIGLLLLLIRHAGGVVRRQQDALSRELAQSRLLSKQNDQLRRRAEQAKLDAVEVNEDLLSRIGADIHDGPLQLLGLAAMRSDDTSTNPTASSGRSKLMSVHDLIVQATHELRQISFGLSVPEVAKLPVDLTLQLAASRHEKQTGSEVLLDLDDNLPAHLPAPMNVSLYRVVQEALNNSFRHAGGRDQKVSARCRDDGIEITISDGGPGIDPLAGASKGQGLGLAGIARRLQTLGGRIEVSGNGIRGTVVKAWLPL